MQLLAGHPGSRQTAHQILTADRAANLEPQVIGSSISHSSYINCTQAASILHFIQDKWVFSGIALGEHQGDIWEFSGCSLGVLWKIMGKHQGVLWDFSKFSRSSLGVLYEFSGNSLGVL